MLDTCHLDLVAALVDKAYPLGGWDSGYRDPETPAAEVEEATKHGSGSPRPLYRCLPPGAVYFLELRPRAGFTREQVIDEFLDRFWLRSLLVRSPDRRKPSRRSLEGSSDLAYFGKLGFGITVMGGWEYATD